MNLEYECHVTVQNDPTKHEQWKILAENWGWKTSCILGDPLLGDKAHFYFTRHHNNIEEMFHLMRCLIKFLLPDTFVLREKIELIIYDTKKKLLHENKAISS